MSAARMRRASTHLLEVWRTDLPGLVLFLHDGNAVDWFGYGLILPSEIIYLHQIRGLDRVKCTRRPHA